MVEALRTGVQTTNVSQVMDGPIHALMTKLRGLKADKGIGDDLE
jgi:hypothetical protein